MIAELSKRRVFRVISGYAIVCFVILQIADVAFEPLGIGDDILRIVIAAMLLALPLVAYLSWIFDIDPDSSLQRSKGGRPWLEGSITLVALVGLAVGAWFVLRPSTTEMPMPAQTDVRQASPKDEIPAVIDASVAVLPLRTSSTDPTVLALADGLTGELVTALSGPRLEPVRRLFPLLAQGLKVSPVASTRRYRNTDEDPASIGKSLKVSYLVDGSVRPGDGNLRVTLQLIRAVDNKQIWSHTYDRVLSDPLAVQKEIAGHAAHNVTATIPNDFWYLSLRAEFPDNYSYEYFVRAHRDGTMRSAFGDSADLLAAIENYEKSLELHPTSGVTYHFLIELYLGQLNRSIEWVAPIARIDELLKQVGEIVSSGTDEDAGMPAHRSAYSFQQFDYENVHRYARQALDENPNNWGSVFQLGLLSIHQGDLNAARVLFRRAIDAGGTIPEIFLTYARTLRASGQHVEAVEFLEGAIGLIPGDYGKCRMLLEQTESYLALTELARATELVDQAWALCGTQHAAIFATAFARTSRIDRAAAILREQETGGDRERLNPVAMISAYVALNDLEGAFRWINKGIEAKHLGVVTWMHYPKYDQQLLDDPRWQQALSRLPEVPKIL